MNSMTPGRCYLCAEIGLNHQGDIGIAKTLIRLAKEYGWDCVKFQKRTLDVLYTNEELAAPYDSPWGNTFGHYKHGREFDQYQYRELDKYCKEVGIPWTASVWDVPAVSFLTEFDIPYIKVPSACMTDKSLLEAVGRTKKPVFVSTGMCNRATIVTAVRTIENAGGQVSCVYHCNSAYPTDNKDINLLAMVTLRGLYPRKAVGYSGHERGVVPSVMAAVCGADSIERHITLDRAMFGSDHAASLEPEGFRRVARDVRLWESVRGDGVLRVTEAELPLIEKLRRVNDLGT